ncbi:MAG: hypothetical protein A3J67_06325 [Parcubacteria group bacterium RIFCSPHIGHO2_02_FULL_48_10b]|nr:MAG: hypothetical protein A3J67_06325 [Parcubacteria group bacterium RIFCSPHIGHO2_02_FULL_48_10b]
MVTDRVLAEASFSVNYAFPKEGRYLVSVNVLHENHGVSKQFFVDVGARGTPTFRKDLSRVKEFGGYQVLFRPPPAGLRSRESASIWYRIEKDGKGVSDLEEYLGAPMHLAIISADLSYFLHTHGEIHDPQTRAEKHTVNASDKFGPEIEAHVTFPFPGIYQIFSQFSRQGESVLTSFMVEVGPGEAGSAVMESMEPHGH